MDLVRVICTDFQSIREVDLEYENLKMEQFYSRYPSDIKLVCVNMPERCTEQLAFVSHKLENCQHEWKRKALRARRMELEWLEKNRQRKSITCFYMSIPRSNCPMREVERLTRLEDARLDDVNHQTGKNRSINKNDESRTNIFLQGQIGRKRNDGSRWI